MKELVIYPDDDLRKVSEPVTEFGGVLAPWIDDMIWVMRSLCGNALGISGIQCRIPYRIALLEMKGFKFPPVICNPEVISERGLQRDPEGCLSFPGKFSKIERAMVIQVRYKNQHGNACLSNFRGIMARCVLHEIDHMDGKLFIDRVDDEERKRITGER